MIELAELIRDLRDELNEAMAAAPATGLRFEMGPVEVEVSVAVDKSVSGGGKVKFWVVEAGSDGKVARTSAHRVTMTLMPRLPGTDAVPYVSGLKATEEE
ncbi:trypco2 family protein [Streptomyces sp. NPDC001404]|uniref:trypco2 family protein n=1 Tax=Streptomyces sp. NPDC001404 TaxID=3364571 RepID=UPI0036BCF27B